MALVKLRRGDDFRRRVRWKGVAGAPLDLTGYVVTAAIIGLLTVALAGCATFQPPAGDLWREAAVERITK